MFKWLTGSNKVDNESQIQKDKIAELLNTSKEALDTFEETYRSQILSIEPEGLFDTNSRQAASKFDTTIQTSNYTELEDKIVAELLSRTSVYEYHRDIEGIGEHRDVTSIKRFKAIGTGEVTNQDLSGLPLALRPQLTGSLMQVDLNDIAYQAILYHYNLYKNGKTMKERQFGYNHFRQGLDILDLDGITYDIIGTNPNSMGNWFPQLVKASQGQGFFKIPSTSIVKVPLTLLQLTRLDYRSLTPTTLNIVNKWAYESFGLSQDREYFIKTGTYSSKFDFRNAYVHGPKEVKELGEYLLYIHFQALQMASPLCTPCIYGVSTTNEWVVREFIRDVEDNPCIYKGLPLHTEYRVFVDCDTKEVIGISPYWEPDTMKKRFGHEEDANNPHQLHDYVIYKSHENRLMSRYEENKHRIIEHVKYLIQSLDLVGQWSIDIMQNGEDFWIIDMALAKDSTFYECIPEELRKPVNENWIPSLNK